MVETIGRAHRHEHWRLRLRGRWHDHIRGYVAIEAGPVRRALAHVAVESVGARAAVEARVGEAKVAVFAECARILWVRTAADVAARNALVVHERDAHARVEAWRREARVV